MQIKCLVCQHQGFEYIIPNYYCSESSSPLGYRYDSKDFYVMCEKCGTIIRSLPYTNKEMVSDSYYYDAMSVSSSDRSVRLNHIRFAQIENYKILVRFLSKHLPADRFKFWLDVGSSGPATLEPIYDFTTIEPDPTTVSIGRDLFDEDKIICATIDRYRPNREFDGIVFHNSFYCLSDPRQALTCASRLLRNGGILLIAITNYFCDTASTQKNGKHDSIEDVIGGQTEMVYYNPISLEYLLQQFGFKLLYSKEVRVTYSKRTMRYLVFCKDDSVELQKQLVEQSRVLMISHLDKLDQSFRRTFYKSIRQINQEDTVLIGNLKIILEIHRLRPLDRVYGVVDYCNLETGQYYINGLSVRSLSCILKEKENKKLKIVIVSFRHATAIIEILKKYNLHNDMTVLVPTRTHGFEEIHMEFLQKKRLIKSLRLNCWSSE